MKKMIGIFCGGNTYEHEVSIITGIQVMEHIDREKYTPVFVYFDKDNKTFLIENFKKKSDFKKNKKSVSLTKTEEGLQVQINGILSKSIQLDAVYLAFHGGTGESGPVQGFLELCNVPTTSPSTEGSVISMNKVLTKQVLASVGVEQLPFAAVTADSLTDSLDQIKNNLTFPVIIKPAHLGSSIGISIANSNIELEQQLKLALQLDTEVLVEPALSNFTEYNVSVRSTEHGLECSPIEEPVKSDETLSFEDKYENGGKKSGGAGMESLERVLPAKIDEALKNRILSIAQSVYRAARLGGLVRIDFLYTDEQLYCSEINPIPGSMSFYLWEAAGEEFQSQISQSIENAIVRKQKEITIYPYETDIVDKFIAS